MSLVNVCIWRNTCVNENYNNYYIYILEHLLSDRGQVASINCASQRWFHSPDGVNYTELNGSFSKYMIANNNMLQINFGNVNTSDEGIYGCLDGTIDQIQSYVGCLKVYGESCYRSTRVLYHKGVVALICSWSCHACSSLYM